MTKIQRITDYLTKTYRPNAVILYGSFADGTQGEFSDFDALVIADVEQTHDASVIDGTILDVFVYPSETFLADYDPEEFLQVYDGQILSDRHGIAAKLKEAVRSYIDSLPLKSEEALQTERDWCEKMLSRTLRGDAEGLYRHHWLLCDSLEIYCDLRRRHYFGPKKTLKQMEHEDPESFRLYEAALREFSHEALGGWVRHLLVL